jgi:hypothetical protein
VAFKNDYNANYVMTRDSYNLASFPSSWPEPPEGFNVNLGCQLSPRAAEPKS